MEPFPANPEGLLRAILARTSGPACARVEELACDFTDGLLDALQADLVRAHARDCPACEGLLAALAEAREVLPALAAADPGPGFTAKVLQATLHAPPSRAWSLWQRLLHRPRIALETAYVGALAAFAGFSLPIPHHPRDLRVPPAVQATGAAALRAGTVLAGTGRRAEAALERAWDPVRDGLRSREAALGRAWARFQARKEKAREEPNP